jgi:DNA-binding transcriptional LysR family regulator
MIDTRHLQHFLAVAEDASFRQAARAMHLSQPALTKSIQRMESLLGEKLFDRGQPVELTPFGRLMREQAQGVLAGLKDLEREAELFRGVERGELRIGVGPYIAHSIVGPALGRLLAKHPKLRLTVLVEDFTRFPALLRERAIDLFVADVTLVKSDPKMEILPAPREEVLWFVRPGHPLAGRQPWSLGKLFNYPFVAPVLPPWALAWFDEHLPASAKPLRVTLTCSNYTTLKDIVRHSDCFAGLPRSAIIEDLREGKLTQVRVKGRKLFANAGVVWLKGRTPSPAATALVAELRKEIARLIRLGGEFQARAAESAGGTTMPKSFRKDTT